MPRRRTTVAAESPLAPLPPLPAADQALLALWRAEHMMMDILDEGRLLADLAQRWPDARIDAELGQDAGYTRWLVQLTRMPYDVAVQSAECEAAALAALRARAAAYLPAELRASGMKGSIL